MKASTGFWQRLRFKYRVSVLNENTLNEVWHSKLSPFSLIVFVSLLLLLSLALMALIIWLTPLKNYMPGYDSEVRQDLYSEIERVDSISTELTIQREYLSMIHNVLSGDIESDSVAPLDSVAVYQREQLLEARSAVTESFVSQYEEKEREMLLIFDSYGSTPSQILFRPVEGAVEQHFIAGENQSVAVRAPKGANVMATLKGTIIYVARDEALAWVMMVQHDNDYLSVYRGMHKPLHNVGDKVRQGESIGLMDEDGLLTFELWQRGNPINSEEAIGW